MTRNDILPPKAVRPGLGPPASMRPPGRRAGYRRGAAAVIMASPALALFTVLMTVPLLIALFYSFTNWGGYGDPPHYVGLANYRRLLSDPGASGALVVTALIAAFGTVVINGLAISIACLINQQGRIYKFYRAAIFYPYVVSPIISGFLWNAILNPDGAANTILKGIHLGPAPFLTSGHWAVASLTTVIVWNSTGFSVVLYLAGLQAIPEELTEAATIDGATAWQRFRQVTVPMLSSTVTINLVLIMVGLLATYDIVLSLTGGGPDGRTQTIAYRILAVGYNNGELGYACAGGVVLFLATAVLAAVVLWYRSRAEVTAL
jgi:raffinose/stachyose/melibiose transport system permease protein